MLDLLSMLHGWIIFLHAEMEHNWAIFHNKESMPVQKQVSLHQVLPPYF